jgi:class 3 adenylate cyclase
VSTVAIACTECGQEYRDARPFCGRCGARLGMACPACGATNGPDERFCRDCGAPLTTRPPAAVAARSGSPPPAREAEGERKQLTVLFADVQGSMELQEELDVELWAQIVDRFVNILADGVHRFGGTVDKFTGDGIMALFGAPLAQEDHARRACHAARHMARAIRTYAEELRRSDGVDLHVRIGLNSGEVVVGRVGDDVRIDPTALGHTVGLAQRMEALAVPGSAYLTEHTARLVEGWFRLRDLGPMTVKGAREPLGVFVLEGPAPPRSKVGHATTRLVGRASEMARLEEALTRASEGHAQVIGVVGEPGVGKSRLCDEFARTVLARGMSVGRAAGVSHGREVPLLPILAYLREYFGITEVDSAGQARERISDRLLGLDPTFADDLPLFFDFLEVPDPERPAPQMAADVRMRRIFEVLRRVTARRSAREIRVLVFEDLHWFDPQSAAFLERLIENFPGSRTLVVTNFRPEFSAAWMRHSYYQQISLVPLSAGAVREMLNDLLGDDPSLAPVPAYLVERTGGNPFFVEEVVRALVEDGTLAGRPGAYRLTRPLEAAGLPASVQAVLAARIDRLAPEHKPVLQCAAVIGRTFGEAVLARVVGQAVEILTTSLSALCTAELVQEAQRYPVAEYRFWHPLTQEVAYGSMLAGRRARLHAAVAEALIELDADHLDEEAAVLAWHWQRAGRRLEAARWTLRAGTWALGSDLAEARRRWVTALQLLEAEAETPETLELGLRVRMMLLRYGARAGIDRDEAERLEAEGRGMADQLGNLGLRGLVVVASGSPRFWSGDIQGALDRYIEAARLGEEMEDPDFEATMGIGAAYAYHAAGPLAEGVGLADRAIRVCGGDVECGVALMGYSVLARMHSIRSASLARMGRLPEAAADVERALTLARGRGETETVCWTLAMLPLLAWLSGDGQDTSDPAAEAVRLAEDTGDVASLFLALEGLALAHLVAARPGEAVALCERALAVGREKRSGLFAEASVLAHLALARLETGDQAAAGSVADEAVAVARRQGARVLECLGLVVRARVARWSGAPSDAVRADLDAALTLVQETGAHTYEPLIREELGRLRADESELREAVRLYEVIGATGHALRLRTELEGEARAPESPTR